MASFWTYVAGIFTGAASLAALGRFLPALGAEVWRYWGTQREARRVVALQADPLLKAADELQGKLLSLAREDFSEFRTLPEELSRDSLVNLCSTLYLFGQFWARFELLRRESFHAELGRDKRGASMLRFVQTLESRQVRLLDRAWQRAIGESLVVSSTGRVLPFRDFVEQYEQSERLREWFAPLTTLLRSSRKRKPRQKLLQYGVIIHALIDTLDGKHHTTKNRPGYPNKLSRRSRRDLIGRAFGVYLPEVRNISKYTGPPLEKKGPAA